MIETHTGPDLDVLVHVLAGSGELDTERGGIGPQPGALVWLLRRSQRRFAAGPQDFGVQHVSLSMR